MRTAKITLLAALGIVVTVWAVLGAGPAAAQTPDLLPPAVETVCDAETGAAFGLCNAYCEAMDCELANDGDPLTEPKASSVACNRVGTKFEQLTGRGLPCEASCPCSSDPAAFPVWAAYLAGFTSATACAVDAQYCADVLQPTNLCTPPDGDVTFIVTTDGDLIAASSLGLDFASAGEAFCFDSSAGLFPLTPAQGEACKAQLDAVLNASGLVCEGLGGV